MKYKKMKSELSATLRKSYTPKTGVQLIMSKWKKEMLRVSGLIFIVTHLVHPLIVFMLCERKQTIAFLSP